MKPNMGIAECVQILRDNNISKTEKVLRAQIQAGIFPEWSKPSVGTKEPCPDISRARFMAWVKDLTTFSLMALKSSFPVSENDTLCSAI